MKKVSVYSQIILVGRLLRSGHKFSPEEMVSIVNYFEEKLRWTPVKDFFQLFPPIKKYNEPDVWDYHSTIEMIEKEFGERFGKDDFRDLIMTKCYENVYVHLIGKHFIKAVSELRKRQTLMSLIAELILRNKI